MNFPVISSFFFRGIYILLLMNIWFITGEGKKDFLNVNFEDGVMSEGTKVKRYDTKSIAKGRDD